MRPCVSQSFRRFLSNFLLQRLPNLRMLHEEFFRLIPPLADFIAFVADKGAGFRQYLVFEAKIDEITLATDTFVVNNIEFCLPEWRSDLVLHHLHPHAITHNLLTIFTLRRI